MSDRGNSKTSKRVSTEKQVARLLSQRSHLTEGSDRLTATAEQLSRIVTRQDAEAAGAFLRGVRTRLRAIESHYKPIKAAVRRAMNESLREIKVLEDGDAAPWEEADRKLSEPLEAWLLADRKRAEEENRRVVEAAQAKAEAERAEQAEALRVAAAAAPSAREQRRLQAEARAVERSPALPVLASGAATEAAKIEGIAVPTTHVLLIVDEDALLKAVAAGKVSREAIKWDQSWLDEQARQRPKDLNFPGCVVREKTTLSARGV
jgi:hypothetical protein